MKEEEMVRKALARCKVDALPDFVKKTLLDKDGNLTKASENFIGFFEALKKVFNQHFTDVVSKYTPEETWDILINPSSCIKYICESFMEEYRINIIGKMSESELEGFRSTMPENMLPLIHKQFVMSSIFSLPNAILTESRKKQILYYKMFSKDGFIDDETAMQRLLDVMENFQKQMDQLNNAVQCEWQDHALDTYNKKTISKEMMEFVMEQANKRKV